jgi:hypothetical protein
VYALIKLRSSGRRSESSAFFLALDVDDDVGEDAAVGRLVAILDLAPLPVGEGAERCDQLEPSAEVNEDEDDAANIGD